MKKMIVLVYLILTFLAPLAAEEQIAISWQAEEAAIHPGRPFHLLITVNAGEGWHTYWKNPGESGFPTEISWELPQGVVLGEVHWPTPERMEVAGALIYGYHGPLHLIVELIPSQEISPLKDLTIKAHVSTLACSSENCLPGEADLSLTLPLSAGSPQKLSRAVEAAWGSVPKKVQASLVARQGDQLRIKLSHPLKEGVYTFYPETNGVLKEEVILLAAGDEPEIELHLLDQTAGEVKGILVSDHSAPIELKAPLASDIALLDLPPLSDEVQVAPEGFFLMLVFAFIGGAILNLMPCVLPVVSLKIFSLVKLAGENRIAIIRHGLFFTLGVMVSFWAVAGALLALKASGATYGWGFQLQEPLFVGGLIAFLFIFALSLFGVFELGTSLSSWAGQKQADTTQGKSGSFSAFMSGVLATAVATPCTGPFLGSAVGFAMTASAPLAMLIFSSMGLGMAAPYLLVSFFPSLIRFLPKPGAWMMTFKELLGFCMVATALWLAWVFGALTGSNALFLLLGALFIFAIAAWILGKWATPLKPKRVRTFSTVIAALLALFGGGVIYSAAKMPPELELVAMNDDSIRSWQPFSEEKLEELTKSGTPVFIDFTARWCLICQANHLILEQVADHLESKGVVKMKGDLTRNDPLIAKVLKKHGRSGVPLYLYYDGKSSEPQVLPQVLTPELVASYVHD